MEPTPRQLQRKLTLIGIPLPRIDTATPEPAPEPEEPFLLTRRVLCYDQQAVIIPPPRRYERTLQVRRIEVDRPRWGWAALAAMALTALVVAVAL
jgi:hypothetical protein